ncbi:hypothetical protein LTR97_008220 [Elasticomyces elasticus]|uniref:Nuclear pore complex protein Nup85 n=1 Tax=Elasticomyces elasticus TaxID=574655 RepID=A0AAN7W3G8_9PEZI|nr:hypothetical protein LTR97_008220 [Elasticomyces elasticus]
MSSSFNTPSRRKPLFPGPSTTPAGPPPSHLSFTQVSTTPAGPPPKSSFFSSHNAANNTFGSRRGAAGATPAHRARGFVVPSSSPPAVDEEEEEDEDEEDDDEEMEVEERPEKSAFMSSILSAPRGLKRSRNGAVREQVGSDYASIARSVTSHIPSTNSLTEPDEMLLQQETILSRLETSKNTGEASEALTRLWARYSDPKTREGKLGPEAEDGVSKAVYLASLLLTLHHPHLQQPSKQQPRGKKETTTLPRALLNWLDEHHTPFPDEYPSISTASPSPAAHDRFWDTIYASLVRGRFSQAIQLLRHAGWENAYTAEEDSQEEGYTEKQLDNIEEVAERAARLLESCPVIKGGEGDGDWDIKGPAWTVFRLRVRQAVRELEEFAGSAEEDDDEEGVGSGKRRNVFSLSAATKKAESRVPWSIYTNLKLCYDILLGQPEEIMDASQDWLEASIYITVWWDGEDTSPSLSSRSTLGESRGQGRKSITASQAREVDLSPLAAYRRRLADAFTFVTDTEEALFLPETVEGVQVGLGCVLTGEVGSVVQLLRGWSLPVAVAVVEVAGKGGWLPGGSRGGLGRGFSSQDLMVLSHGPGGMEGMGSAGLRDEILAEYAGLLAGKDVLRVGQVGGVGRVGEVGGGTEREGWELAVAVLGRMDDQAEGERRVGELLGGIEVRGEGRVDRILEACGGLGLEGRGRGVAERFADSLLASPDTAEVMRNVGTALMYLSRARCGEKISETLGLLVSLCLIHSAAYPAREEMDERLAGLVGKERSTLVELARKDGEAAELLASRLSGYATLRRFYELRDQDVLPDLGNAQKLRPLERAREAAGALMAVLGSASDCIRGGLYDPEAEGVVPVDCVLALLGEALVLLGQGKRVFSKEQVFGMMRVVEDFEAVTSRVRENGGALLGACLGAYRESGSGGGMGRMGKSGSAFGGSSWDMLAESTMVGPSAGGMGKVERGWDWRRGVDELGVEAGGKEVVAMVRVALAREVARGWGGGLNW